MQAEVVEAAGLRIESDSRPDEVQEILSAGGLEEDHPLVGKCGLETEDVDVEALGGAQVARLEGQMSESTAHTAPVVPLSGGLRARARAGRAWCASGRPARRRSRPRRRRGWGPPPARPPRPPARAG